MEILDPGVDLGRLLPKIETYSSGGEGLRASTYGEMKGVRHIGAHIGQWLFLNRFSVDNGNRGRVLRSNKEVDVEVIDEDGVEQWCETYILSFYEEKIRTEPVLRAVRKSLRGRRTRLILARVTRFACGGGGAVRGEGALRCLLRRDRTRFRNIGVASTMLEFAVQNYRTEPVKGSRCRLDIGFSRTVLHREGLQETRP